MWKQKDQCCACFRAAVQRGRSYAEDQVTREEAVCAQAVASLTGLQPHLVPWLQLHNCVPCRCLPTTLINLKAVQHQLTVTPQAHVSYRDEGCTNEAELVDSTNGAGEPSCLCAVMVLSIVDDLSEANDFFRRGIVIAQSDRKGRL